MVGFRRRGEEIRQYILSNIEHPDIAQVTSHHFGISRQAANKHLQHLAKQKIILVSGKTRNRHYELAPLVQWENTFSLKTSLQEDIVWRNSIMPLLGEMSDNTIEIWSYGFTEMLNNAIDHSCGDYVCIQVTKTAIKTKIVIWDNGEGIFVKIQKAFRLLDERHSVLELSKGKLTTDPTRHTGEGIFFSSRLFDNFAILSGNVYFSHTHNEIEDWILESQKEQTGTYVFMELMNNTSRKIKQIFDNFTSGDEYGFSKTVVPVRLAKYGDELLMSRSQAKRLLARIDRFKTVIFDFDNVSSLGQAFADEVFRVFSLQNKHIELHYINANKEVTDMINRVKS